MSGRQRWVYRVERRDFPADFAERLECLRTESQLSWRGLARSLRMPVRNLRRWRSGTQPDAAHLLALFSFAAERGLLHCLLPEALDQIDSAANAPGNHDQNGGAGVRYATERQAEPSGPERSSAVRSETNKGTDTCASTIASPATRRK